jgi:hypothetical protein
MRIGTDCRFAGSDHLPGIFWLDVESDTILAISEQYIR